jgi:2-oxo-4-hydroxy-4-carboxy--5-ureidoimidazoline (OHCU) decarboxylase
LSLLNEASAADFTAACAGFFEHSPWVAERAATRRPIADRDTLHKAMCAVVAGASADEKMRLIRAHPDLVGRPAKAGSRAKAPPSRRPRG